jgi:hypothetical protein
MFFRSLKSFHIKSTLNFMTAQVMSPVEAKKKISQKSLSWSIHPNPKCGTMCFTFGEKAMMATMIMMKTPMMKRGVRRGEIAPPTKFPTPPPRSVPMA